MTANKKNNTRNRPNILLIMTDQQRGDCLSIAGHPVLLTPNMDTIAGNGVRFSNMYSTCPTCIAARRSLLSGQFPSTHGMVGYKDSVEWDAPVTLPQALKESGYHTFIVGRNMHQHPRQKRYGYDHKVIKGSPRLGEEGDYEKFLRRRAPEADYFGHGVMHNDWTARPWHLDESLHTTTWTTDMALEFLKDRDPSCPFFLTVSYLAPHPPLAPPAFYMERYLRMDLPEPVTGDWESPPPNGGKGLNVSSNQVNLTGEALRSCRAAYYGLINHIDDQIRRILNPVQGIDKMTGNNTIVVFTSDHGEMLGDHYMWHKKRPYEPSACIPLMFRAPERFGLDEESVLEQPAALEDIMPTLLDMAEVDIPETVEGRSLFPLMRGEEPQWREYLHIEHSPLHHGLTDGREKFIWYVKEGAEQFFNLAEDPNECHNLIDQPEWQKRVDIWRRRLVEELKDRPEGFSDGGHLISGVPYPPVMPHALPD